MSDRLTGKLPSMDRTLEQYDSKFRFVLLASARAEQLLRGARPKLDLAGKKPSRIAMEELRRGQISWEYGLPPEPEEEAAGEGAAEEGVAAEGAEH
ncbi:MAG TPA: DNA-directed RNA polymerase subunit omega [Thermoanaerobaculia bacterium]|nr:DNA-directed RNA polymerase subunit omega [Thermoanaerobaculia bacterium]